MLAVIGSLCFGTVALAADPIDVDVTWTGSGSVGGTVVAGSTLATTNWGSTGNSISGTFTADYNVGGTYNSYSTSMDASVTDGIIEFVTTRGALGYTDGSALELGGQQSYSFVGTGWYTGAPIPANWNPSTGTVDMTTRTACTAVFATHKGTDTSLVDNTYGWGAMAGKHNFSATATDYTIIREMLASDGAYIQGWAVGSGTADMDCGWAKAHRDYANGPGGPGYDFNWLKDFTATGTGYFTTTGEGETLVTFYDIVSPTGGDPGKYAWGGKGIPGKTADNLGWTATGNGTPGSAQIWIQHGWTSSTFTHPNWKIGAN